MRNSAKVGGILSLVGAGFSLLAAFACLGFIVFVLYISMNTFDAPSPMEEFAIVAGVYGIGALFFVVMGVLGIVGGIFALKKKSWGMALTAAIAGTFAFSPAAWQPLFSPLWARANLIGLLKTAAYNILILRDIDSNTNITNLVLSRM